MPSEPTVTPCVCAATVADLARLASAHERLGFAGWDRASLGDMLVAAGVTMLLVDTLDGVDAVPAGERGAPLGFLLARSIAGETELLTLGVAAPARRKGLASALLARLLLEVQRVGSMRVLLEVACDNVAARRLYARLGFTERAVRRGYYLRPGAPPVDALLLALDLVPAASRAPR